VRSAKIARVLRASLIEADFEYDESDPPGYRCGSVRISSLLGVEALAVRAYELPPGESMCPYHYEYEEEWLLVLQGAVIVRTPEGEHELGSGEASAFSTGPAGAHKVSNRSEEVARVVMFSSAREPAVAVYPDSDKIGVWPGNSADDVMLRRSDGARDYWDGES
jgi:uncharacterized cupin superfamily protein